MAAATTALKHGVKMTVSTLLKLRIKVLVIAPSPEHRFDAPKCRARKTVEFCSITREDAEKHRSPALTRLKTALLDAPNARLWDPFTALCNTERCTVEHDSIILYHDDNHLTYTGSRWLAPYLQKRQDG
jgi:alpha-D-ribose 1-methylphosphonate 5-phosphate C-P lyase